MTAEPPDEFDDLREAWDRFAADLRTALLDGVIRTAYRVAWALDRIKHG
ncbi:hypothetical protein [Promicromonospora kroppenstedtii]|nr:hypothetical protein [Promicromonospora kroppenstedtii]